MERYSKARSARGGCWCSTKVGREVAPEGEVDEDGVFEGEGDDPNPLNKAALYSCPSALITPSAPVALRQLSMSDWNKMLPLAKTGTDTASLTALILSQSAKP
jgi:hypothetical protein